MARRFPAGTRAGFTEAAADHEPDFDWSWAEDGPAWVSPVVDTRRASVARIYNYALGGKDNYGLDRELAQRLFDVVPDARDLASANRDFIVRAVRFLAEVGIRQFLDLGCGTPTQPAVHEVARMIIPDARVAYLDHDPIVLAHTRAVLDGQPGLYAALHDIREPSRVLQDPGVRGVISLDEPVGLIMGAVLHFIDLSIGVQVVDHYLRKIAPGSHVAFSVATSEGVPSEVTQAIEQIFGAAFAPIAFRTRAQVEELIDGLHLLPPGMTDVTQWRTDGSPGIGRLHAGIAVKR